MKIALIGYGKMGRAIEKIALEQDDCIETIITRASSDFSSIEKVDVCIDFSAADSAMHTLTECIERKKPLIMGTTGWEEKLSEAKQLVKQSQGALLYAPNFSFGVYYFSQIVKYAASLQTQLAHFAVEGLEVHHSEKKDVPSGTAKHLASFFPGQVNFNSKREGAIAGIHTLCFSSDEECITLSHEAKNREAFAMGAYRAARWILGKKGWFTLDDLFKTY